MSAHARIRNIVRRMLLSSIMYREDANEADRKANAQALAAHVLEGYLDLPEEEAFAKLEAAIKEFPAVLSFGDAPGPSGEGDRGLS